MRKKSLTIIIVKKELTICKNKKKIKILTRFKNQTEKYKDNLKLLAIDIVTKGKNKKLIPPRTNNFMESFFRLIKCNLRRNTGRSRLTKEFGSVGDLLPYYMSMSTHKTFKPIFNDEQKLIEEFANLAAERAIVEIKEVA